MNAIHLAISWVLGILITLLLSPLFLMLWAGQKMQIRLGGVWRNRTKDEWH